MNMWENFKDRVLFITGGSGFLGTTLVFRLVTQAPVAHIYILCRGGLPRLIQKWNQWLPPHVVEKMANPRLVTAMEGDILEINMGLKSEHISLLRLRTDIVIHSASSIALLQPLEKLVGPVINATEQLGQLALGWDRLECFVYVSTAYANAFLYSRSDGTADLKIKESIYPIIDQEHEENFDENKNLKEEFREVQDTGSSSAFRNGDFPWAYAYAKHLAERLLEGKFSSSGKRLLIIRPSAIEPAQSFPYRQFCFPMSTPHVICTAALALTFSRIVRISSRMKQPKSDSNIDYVPVDVVVDRLLAHLSYGTSGPVHAVAGTARISFDESWNSAVAFRRFPYDPSLAWTSKPWNSKTLHPIARIYCICGTSITFTEDKTISLWQRMSNSERSNLQLFTDMDILSHDHRDMRNDHIWNCIFHLTKRSRSGRFLAKVFYGSLSRGKSDSGLQ
ncbi:hypothetical protein N7493_005844 [Penicillium malachiteum]|uniref:Fatty acyl-CoA reductase n=1 Tax=Penicillium malachiteum TaxID=1324776 RepID=A0AAD6HLG5_9EURO|nr:hypothetical protein N7493_005844 [Penicillium malachiteum]